MSTLLKKLKRFSRIIIISFALMISSSCEEIIPLINTGIQVYFDLLPLFNQGDYPVYPGSNRWQKSELTYYIQSYANGISVSQQDQIISEAFNTWASVTNLRFYTVNSAGQADIVIGFGSYDHCELYSVIQNSCSASATFDGNGNVLAHAYFPGQGVISGDTHFDADEFWSTSNIDPNSVSLLSVAIHEIGHSLGLDHSQDIYSVMYPSYDSNDIKISLGRSDIDRIQGLYGYQGIAPMQPVSPLETTPVPANLTCGNPTYNDSDGDGIDDITEWFVTGTNPYDCDTDKDGLPDSESRYRLSPLNPDTDGDGVMDGEEVQNGTDPLIPDQGSTTSGTGQYIGSDSFGSPMTLRVSSDGSVSGILKIEYFGYSTDIQLVGGMDVNGEIVLISYDYFFAYYGTVRNGSIEGTFQTAGGATGTWLVESSDGGRVDLDISEAILVDSGVYSPVPDEKTEPTGPVHKRLEWRVGHSH